MLIAGRRGRGSCTGEWGEGLGPGACTGCVWRPHTHTPFLDVGPLSWEEVAWELSEVFPFSLSPFYSGVKVGDRFDQLLILGHPNPLSPVRAWVPGCGQEGLGRAREGGRDLNLASSDLVPALVPPLQETFPKRTHSLCPERI